MFLSLNEAGLGRLTILLRMVWNILQGLSDQTLSISTYFLS